MNPNPFTITLATGIACGFKFRSTKVQVAELFTGTLPKLNGTLLEQADTLVNVGAATPEPSRITERPLICRLALKLAVEVGVNDTVMFSAWVTLEFGRNREGKQGGSEGESRAAQNHGHGNGRHIGHVVDAELLVGSGIERHLAEVVRRTDYGFRVSIHCVNHQLRLGGDGQQHTEQQGLHWVTPGSWNSVSRPGSMRSA